MAVEMPNWSVGLVLMNQNCPPDLRTDEPNFERDVERLVEHYGQRLIITDRFAVAVDTALRRRGVALAAKYGLRTQTHLNEQPVEKQLVERQLYPDYPSYAHVYHRDGLLDHRCIVAHCIHMRPEEWSLLRDTGSTIAHCPTSNLLLQSGTMDLDEVIARGILYALATDVGASPTVSMLAEMKRFLTVHTSTHATPSEALYRSTLAPAQILGLDLGDLSPGHPFSFIEVAPCPGDWQPTTGNSPDDAILSLLPPDPDRPDNTVNRVTLAGRVVFDRNTHA
jgi:guanine deaminase